MADVFLICTQNILRSLNYCNNPLPLYCSNQLWAKSCLFQQHGGFTCRPIVSAMTCSLLLLEAQVLKHLKKQPHDRAICTTIFHG